MVYKAVSSSSAGPGGVLPAGTSHGEILQWDVLSGAWVPVGAPSAEGDALVWDAVSGEWIAQTIQTWSLQFASTQIPVGTTFLTPGAPGAAATAVQAHGQDVVTRAGFLRRFTIMHQVTGIAAALAYVVQVQGIDTALAVSLNGNQADEAQDAINVVAVANLDRVGIKVTNPAAAATTPRVIGRIEFFAFV